MKDTYADAVQNGIAAFIATIIMSVIVIIAIVGIAFLLCYVIGLFYGVKRPLVALGNSMNCVTSFLGLLAVVFTAVSLLLDNQAMEIISVIALVVLLIVTAFRLPKHIRICQESELRHTGHKLAR